MLLSSRTHSRHLTAGKLFETRVYFASVVSLVEISGIQICGWLHEVSELSVCDNMSVQLAYDHTIFASSGLGLGTFLLSM